MKLVARNKILFFLYFVLLKVKQQIIGANKFIAHIELKVKN